MKYPYLILLLLFFVGCKEKKNEVKTLFPQISVNCYPTDKSKADDKWGYYTIYSTGRNLNLDTSIHKGDTVTIQYGGDWELYSFIKQDSTWLQIK